jgi:hypothetical protein
VCLTYAFTYGAKFIPLFTNQYFYEKIYIYKRSIRAVPNCRGRGQEALLFNIDVP